MGVRAGVNLKVQSIQVLVAVQANQIRVAAVKLVAGELVDRERLEGPITSRRFNRLRMGRAGCLSDIEILNDYQRVRPSDERLQCKPCWPQQSREQLPVVLLAWNAYLMKERFLNHAIQMGTDCSFKK